MTVFVSGSIATDQLMTFPGRFADQFVEGRLEHLSLSFLVDSLEIRRGGVGGNIAFAMGVLGRRPLLVGAAGQDFADYRRWLDDHGVDTSAVTISERHHTARFVCTTDTEASQLASFYPGAMAEAADIALADVVAEHGTPELVLVGPNDPGAMLRHTREAREAGIPFAADPSQQLAFLDGDAIRDLVDGARYLFSNEYEFGLLLQKTGWEAADVDARVGTRITTRSERGILVVDPSVGELDVPVVPAREVVDPTGVGDAFRGGFLTGVLDGLGLERATQLGAAVATLVVETTGPQEWSMDLDAFRARAAAVYGDAAADEITRAIRA